ncbi:chemotaxis protein CheW [Anaeromyxobacter terrae]|uniref:chemotaxis protein CheW n=1 Tax=Anaeromyxobacter terrae TaxID=2925406 RepID=UPI001F59E09E|nr:chemotaxis protein CheW [Anaeromyxobacter sp. SG22]
MRVTGAERRALVEELRAIEREYQRVRAGLVALGPGEHLPGLYLVAGVAGGRVLLPAARAAELARRVAFDKVPGAAPWLLGSFVWRGRPALAVDLGVRLGGAPAQSLDAMMVILDGAPTVALVVEEVHGLVEDPLLADGAAGAGEASRLVLGACRVEDEAVPVLAPEIVERDALERS